MMAAAAMRKPFDWKRAPKNSGIVDAPRRCVISRVRGPSTHQAKRLPRMALPMPIHVAAIPYFQPNCPA